jgi:hypothetical protein
MGSTPVQGMTDRPSIVPRASQKLQNNPDCVHIILNQNKLNNGHASTDICIDKYRYIHKINSQMS